MKNQPIADAIYITLGASQIKEHGYQKYVDDFNRCDGNDGFWYYRMKNLPTKEFVDVFLVIGNKVRWKAKLLEIQKDVEVHYWNGNHDDHFCGLILFDFQKLPTPYETKKGFQGFRYKYS